jgi:pimeloyl-ACP methyl ester carboxylesterase
MIVRCPASRPPEQSWLPSSPTSLSPEAEVKHSHAFWPRIFLPLAATAAIGIAIPAIAAQARPAAVSASARPVSAPTSARGCSLDPSPPPGFTEKKVKVNGIGINYVRGGHGPALLLLHGYPEDWSEWAGIMPALARHYTVVAPDLPGAGLSDAPAAVADYTKKAMAADIYALMVRLGLSQHVRIVGHDIGTMVAYSYAAARPHKVTRLVLSEAPIPDSSIYTLPALTKKGPGLWWFGLFNDPGNLAYDLMKGKAKVWVTQSIPVLEVVRGAVTPCDMAVYTHFLEQPGHLRASIEWFSALPRDVTNTDAYEKTKLTMPVLALGGSASLGSSVARQVRKYATHVTGKVIPDSGHWLYQEHPAELTRILLGFLR